MNTGEVPKYKVKKIKQTCFACPSQWEGKTECGSEIYIRYRWGFLRIDINDETVFGKQMHDEWDGVCDLEFVQNAQEIVDFSAVLPD